MTHDFSAPVGKIDEKEEPYIVFLREISAFKSRLEKGANLENADTNRFISIHCLEELIKKSGETPDDRFYQRHRFKHGRNSFIEAHRKVALALLPTLFEKIDIPMPSDEGTTNPNFVRFVEALYESEIPTTFPPSAKLIAAVHTDTAERFSTIFNQYAEAYATNALKGIAHKHGLTHIPEESAFAEDTSANAGLNYIFTHASEHEFWCIATAIELSGIDFDEKDWTEGILLTKPMLPDIALDIE